MVAIVMRSDSAGIGRDGGYAPRAVFRTDQAVLVPAGVSATAAAAATDAGRTAVHSVKNVAGVTSATRLGIVGLGGLGLIGLQTGLALGAEVYGAEPKEAARVRAFELGAKAVVEDVDDLAPFELDVIVDFAGYGSTTAKALRSVRAGGTVVLVGLGRDQATINTSDFALRGLTLKSSVTSTLEQLHETLELIGEGKVAPVTTEIGFDEIGEGIERVARGEVIGRLVAVFPDK
ncbi:Alcohol dehydrogenase [Microbacterium trichothecenolyticum]|uniref:alcohol dehydrogenase n=2 Tax=Microbacterium trichothecenolyticum TaxID=69370 RepID=A0A0M2HDP6_MICTR|nr:Alcohol dehydrogenase [Microbacterium trichothecenolyticum]